MQLPVPRAGVGPILRALMISAQGFPHLAQHRQRRKEGRKESCLRLREVPHIPTMAVEVSSNLSYRVTFGCHGTKNPTLGIRSFYCTLWMIACRCKLINCNMGIKNGQFRAPASCYRLHKIVSPTSEAISRACSYALAHVSRSSNPILVYIYIYIYVYV